MKKMNPTEFLQSLFDAAVSRAQPAKCIPNFMPEMTHSGRTIVIGAGKASAAMAQAVEQNCAKPLEGLVITRYGHAVPCKQIEIVEAAHPVPDHKGVQATARMLEMVSHLTKDDLVLCLISGGGSSLLSLPAEGLSLEDKQNVTSKLLSSGATIHEMNVVRKHLSAIKGGRLAARCFPAKVISLIISDVPGDDLSVIASGPTVADSSKSADAFTVLKKYNLDAFSNISKHLENPSSESIKAHDPLLKNVENYLIATPQQSLEAVAELVRKSGMVPVIIGDSIEGEAREVAKVHAGIAKQIQKYGQPFPAPAVLLSGGETNVTIKGNGKGGRNTEFLLSLLIALNGQAGIWAIACDTDGIDGTEDNAGALITPESLEEAFKLDLNPVDFLTNNDAYTFFSGLNSLLKPGPTLTNVNDFRALLILPNPVHQ